jgi:hypothetical protein
LRSAPAHAAASTYSALASTCSASATRPRSSSYARVLPSSCVRPLLPCVEVELPCSCARKSSSPAPAFVPCSRAPPAPAPVHASRYCSPIQIRYVLLYAFTFTLTPPALLHPCACRMSSAASRPSVDQPEPACALLKRNSDDVGWEYGL